MIENERHRHLNDTWEWLKANPEQHDQHNWSMISTRDTPCGTTGCLAGCLAGWGVLRAGGTINYNNDGYGRQHAQSVTVASLPPDIQAAIRSDQYDSADLVYVSTAARYLFGLGLDEANALFDGDNTNTALEAMVTAVVSGQEFPFDLVGFGDVDESDDEDYDHDGVYDPVNADDYDLD